MFALSLSPDFNKQGTHADLTIKGKINDRNMLSQEMECKESIEFYLSLFLLVYSIVCSL